MDSTEVDTIRPRYGYVTRQDGRVDVIHFLPTDTPDLFRAVLSRYETPLRVGPGDELHIDAVGAGQNVAVEVGV